MYVFFASHNFGYRRFLKIDDLNAEYVPIAPVGLPGHLNRLVQFFMSKNKSCFFQLSRHLRTYTSISLTKTKNYEKTIYMAVHYYHGINRICHGAKQDNKRQGYSQG